MQGHQGSRQLHPHLRQLASGSVLQNRFSPVTDAVANKMAELYVGALAMHFGESVALDEPDHSRGDNPDVMLTFRDQFGAMKLFAELHHYMQPLI